MLPFTVVVPPVVAVVLILEGTVVRTVPAVAVSDRLERAVRLPSTSRPSALLVDRLRAPALVLMLPSRARARLLERERPLVLVLVIVPPRIKLVVISPLVVMPSRLVAATPVLVSSVIWPAVR